MSNLQNKVIWLIGASSGIGEALAEELAHAGARLVITARRKERLEEIANSLNTKGCSVFVFPADVTDQKQVKAMHAQIASAVGEVDILITNAGTYKPTDATTFSASEYAGIMQLNYTSMLYAIEAVLPSMIARKSGQLVGVASLVGYRGLPRASSYGASKAAVINFLEALRFDLLAHGVLVSIVNPGFVKTPLTDKNDFQMPFLVEAKDAAKIIRKGIEKKKKEIHFPWQFSWIFKLFRILPYSLYEKLVAKRTIG